MYIYRVNLHEKYMHRCLQLAANGLGNVAPNPMVGAVLVYEDKIIGEGYHTAFGMPHAEVACLNSVKEEHLALISKSTLYVSLEPCSHYGKTPPCADFILSHGIQKVVVAGLDPNPLVAGNGLKKLQNHGVEVITGVLEQDAILLNKRFYAYHTKKRPYIVLKFAQSIDGFIGKLDKQIKISNDYTNVLVHQWRREEQSILIGKNTARIDNPSLTVRHVKTTKNPIRILLDASLEVLPTAAIFNSEAKTICIHRQKNEVKKIPNVQYIKTETDSIIELLDVLYAAQIQSVLVEGGAQVLQAFLDAGLWDECRVITGNTYIENGVKSPDVQGKKIKEENLFGDKIVWFLNE